MASDRISVRIPVKLQEDLKTLLNATGKTETEVVREALEAYCLKNARLPSAYDVAKKAGMIGCVKDGPKDRSTDPKYLEGFGRGKG